MNHLTKRVACLLAVCLIFCVSVPARAEYIIDDFGAPDAANLEVRVIRWNDPDPSLVQTPSPPMPDTPILGGERDILLDVIGVSRLTSFVGGIGDGTFLFNSSSPGTAATIQYDGDDDDPDGPPAALTNFEGLGGLDLTLYGPAFELEFLSIDGGQAQSSDIEIEVHSSTSTALFLGTIDDSAGPTTYPAPFAAFSNLGVFSDVTSIEFRINPGGAHDVDFELDTISIVPEPSAMALSALGLACLLGFAWRRRK